MQWSSRLHQKPLPLLRSLAVSLLVFKELCSHWSTFLDTPDVLGMFVVSIETRWWWWTRGHFKPSHYYLVNIVTVCTHNLWPYSLSILQYCVCLLFRKMANQGPWRFLALVIWCGSLTVSVLILAAALISINMNQKVNICASHHVEQSSSIIILYIYIISAHASTFKLCECIHSIIP